MSDKQASHFWLLVIGVEGGLMAHRRGLINPLRGETRWDILDRIMDLVCVDSPQLRDGVIMAFDIQPNKL
ncbi:hypothetical protein [Streptomyces erythrochromogenes]|uniref:hypothetical protein n=1 Tax=Streptomyces erythrochromogenes TaxID=285574 RepID=UPI002256DA5B|nr:hypothetical protein [Streptomyces erythrochromogenes]MCX5587560.1 hypothetical protein [Streptomyces erythrochromogenes]